MRSFARRLGQFRRLPGVPPGVRAATGQSRAAAAWPSAALKGGAAAAVGLGLYCGLSDPVHAARSAKPQYMSLDEFEADHGEEVWVSLNGGVYNVTPFLDAHPGGATRIMMVNGLDLAPFWNVYKLHNRPHIRELLEDYRVGTLSPKDAALVRSKSEFEDAYAGEPVRPAQNELRVTTRAPWNHEPNNLAVLTDTFLTPNDYFFVRNHNPVPAIDGAEWRLEIEGNPKLGIKDKSFTLAEIKTKFKKHVVVSALQCAGNRQEDFVEADRPLYVAPHWRNGAIGCAKWAGVKVRDLLRDCGMDVDAMALGNKSTNGIKIVNFIADDTDETGVPYAGVIPVEKVLDPFGDAILAYEMNDEVLPVDHGFPVRLLAPGHAGCRNVKWVNQIILSEEASELDSGSKLDRHFAPDISWDEHRLHCAEDRVPELQHQSKIDLLQGPVIQTLPVQSVLTFPQNLMHLSGQEDSIEVTGVAWSGAGRGICRVEVSLDGGESFTAANLKQAPREDYQPVPQNGMGRNWAWSQFKQRVPLPADVKAKLASGERVELEVVCKAVDGDFNCQPERMKDGWNVLGICINHWPRNTVTLDPAIARGTKPAVPPQPAPGDYIWPSEPNAGIPGGNVPQPAGDLQKQTPLSHESGLNTHLD